MALLGLSLPGLGLSQPSSTPTGDPAAAQKPTTRKEDLAPQTEWRFEVPFGQPYSIRLLSGNAEIFGVELAQNQSYDFSGSKGAVFTYQGCQLEVSGEAESEYAGQETDYAVEWLNVHGMLETARDDAQAPGSEGGPRVLIVGPDFGGKSSLLQSLAGWAVRVGRTPTVVNLDSREGLLAPPGSLSAVTVGSQMGVENGYGISPISGPTLTTVKTPLIYHSPYASPAESPSVYKSILSRLALSVSNRLEEDPAAKQSGLLIDTPGTLNDPKSNYDILTHLISEFSITLILTLGSERLYNDLNRRFAQKPAEDAIPVLRIAKPGGAVERDAHFTKQLQNQQIREYFFGSTKEPLNPHSHTLNFSDLAVFRANSAALAASSTARPTNDDDAPDVPYANPRPSSAGSVPLEKVAPSNEMLGRMVAVKYCSGGSDEATVRDSAVRGFAYVSEVDEQKKRVRFLAPHPQRWGDAAVVFGGWPEATTDLVS